MQPAPEPERRGEDLHLAFTAGPALVRGHLARMLALAPLSGLSDERRGVAEMVLAEVLNNVAEHAYADQPGPVSVRISQTAQGLGFLIVDRGRPMPGGRLPDGRLPGGPTTALEDLPEGGFGWHLIRSLTTDLGYARRDGCNHLQFTLPNG